MPYRLWPAQLTAALVVGTLAVAARLPSTPEAELDALAARFSFTRLPLPTLGTPPTITVHPTNPSVSHIARWLSSVGTSIALGDIDEDGVANDICYGEPRTGGVIVAPVPGTGDRFAAFSLQTNPAWDIHAMVTTGCKIGDFNEDGVRRRCSGRHSSQPTFPCRSPGDRSGEHARLLLPGAQRWEEPDFPLEGGLGRRRARGAVSTSLPSRLISASSA